MSIAGKLQVKADERVVVLDRPDDVDLDLESTDSVDDVPPADARAWVVYPKGGKLDTDLNRDVLAAALAERGVRAVRQVSIDDTWSALRFRPVG